MDHDIYTEVVCLCEKDTQRPGVATYLIVGRSGTPPTRARAAQGLDLPWAM